MSTSTVRSRKPRPISTALYRHPKGRLAALLSLPMVWLVGVYIFSLVMMLAFYIGDRRRHGERGGGSVRLTARMFGVAVPLAVSAYARSALSTLEHLLVPRGFRRCSPCPAR